MDSSLCKNVVKSYYLYQNPLYTFSFPISLICGIIAYGVCVATKCSSNSYMIQIIIPLLTIMIVNWILMKVSCMMLDKDEMNQMTNHCISYVSTLNVQENFESTEESQQNQIQQNQIQQNDDSDLHSPLNIIDNLYDSTYEVINPDTREVHMEYNGLNTANFTPIA